MGEETDNVIESTSKLQSKIKALSGVDILTESGDYKDTYTILKEIGTVWEDMNDIDQAALLELMAGKNRANTLSAILSNMKDLKGAYESAMDAEGSALRENETYLDSIQGRIDLFNNSVQTMWMNLIESDTVKNIVDAGTTLIKFLDTTHGKIIAIVSTLAILAKWKLKVNFTDMFTNMSGKLMGKDTIAIALQKIQSISGTGAKEIGKYVLALKNLSATQQAQILASKGLAESEQLVILTRSLGSEAAAKKAIAEAALSAAQQKATGETLIRTIAEKSKNQEFVKSFVATTGITGATEALTEEQIKAAIAALQQARATGKLSNEQYEAIISTVGLDKATEGLNKNVGGLGKKLNDVWSANKASIIAAGVAIIAFAIDKLTTNLQEASEAATDTFDKIQNVVDSTTSNISSLESELSTIKDQIYELSGKEPSFAEQENLKYLKTQEKSLQRQLDTQNSILAAQEASRNKQAIAAVNAYTKASTQGAEETIDGWKTAGAVIGGIIGVAGWAASILVPGDFGTIGAAATALAAKLGTGTLIAAGAGAYAGSVAGEAIGSGVANGGVNNYEEWYKTYTDAIDAARADEQKALEEYKKDTSSTDKLDKWQEAQQRTVEIETEMYDHLSQMESMMSSIDYGTGFDEVLDDWYNFVDKIAIDNEAQGAVTNALDRLFGEDADEVVKAYANLAKNAVEAGESFNFTEADAETIGLDDDLEALGLTTKDVTDYFTKLGEAGADAIEEIDVKDLVSELAKVEEALGSVKSVMEEFRTEGIVSASTLEGMKETFGGLDEAWENYAETMMSGTASMSEAQAATEALAKAYLDSNINNINKDTRLTYIAQLEQFDVDNAKELVDSYMNNSFWNSSEFANFTGNAEELIALAKEYGVTIEDVTKAEELLTAKENARFNQAQYQNSMVNAATNKHNIETQNAALLQKQQEVISAIENTTIDNVRRSATSLYSYLTQALNRTGQYANYSDEDLNKAITNLKNNLDRELHVLSMEYSWEDLFPELAEAPSVELDPDVVASKEKWDEAEKKFQELCDNMNLTVTPEIETAESIDEFARFESGMKSLSEAYQEYVKEGVVSFGTLSELGDTFGNIQGVKDEYRELIKLMGTSGTSISAIETQVERLATAYLGTIDANKMLIASEEERQVVIDNLTNMGVKNAKDVVNAKLKAMAEVQEAYGIDVTNYQNAEAAKLAAALSTIYGIEVANSGLVTELANTYGIDLSNFTGTEAEKVKKAKEAAKAIAKAHRDAQIAGLDVVGDDLYKNLDPNDPAAMKQAQLLEQKWKRETQSQRDAINAQYNQAIADIDKITFDSNIDKAFVGKDLSLDFNLGDDFWTGDDSGSDSSTALDWLDHYFTKIENKIKEKEADLENVISANIGSINKKNTIIDGIISLYDSKISLLENAINAYKNRATTLFNGFSRDIQNKIKNGSIDISEYDNETAEKIQDYFDYITKASDFGIELESVKVTVADFSLQKFDNAVTAFDNKIEEKFQSDQDVIEAEIGYLEEQGKRVSPKLYQKLINTQKEEQKVLENKKKTLENILATEIAAGHIQVGSEQWYEMTKAINDVDKAILQGKKDIEGFQNSINDINWDNFEKLIDQFDAIDSELSDVFDLLSDDDKIVDEFGNWTDEGIASLGLLAMQMETSQAKVAEYAKAIKKLNEDYAAGKYSLDEYNEKMAKLKNGQLSEIKNIEDAKKAMIDLNKVRVDAVKEAIDKEIEALEEKNKRLKEEINLEKEQYNFQKQVSEKEKSISDIKRRLNALAGDNSASAIAEKRRLRAELAEAEQEMDDMWYEHSLDEQENNLDKSLDNYKENKEDEKEALDKWLKDEEKVIKESFDLFNSNVNVVAGVLSAFEKEHGIKLSAAITDPWNSGIKAMKAYRTKLKKMKEGQEQVKQNAKDDADDILTQKSAQTQATTHNTKQKSTRKSTQTTTSKQGDTQQLAPGYGSTVTIKKSATNFSRNGGNGTKMQSWVPGSSFTVYQSDSDEVLIGRNGVYTGWVKLSDIEGYYKGTTGVEDDQWAFTDELGPELTLHAGPNGQLQYLTKGSSVVTADLTKRLMEWGELDPSQVLKNSAPKLGAPHITTNNMEINLRINEVVHIDHADSNSIQDITSAVHKQMDQYMKGVNQSLKRFTR